MRKDAIRKAVEAKIALGYSRQHAYDEMCLEHPELAGKRLADIVRYIPSMAARERYRTEHGLLLFAIAAYVVLPVLHAQSIPGWRSIPGPAALAALPFATIALGIAIARYRLKGLPWLIFVTALGLFRGLGHPQDLAVDPWTLARYATAIAIAGLSIQLLHKLVSDYRVDRDFSPPRIIFPADDGSHVM